MPDPRTAHPLIKPFLSLKLTIVLLAFSMALVYFGTRSQVHIGIHEVQERYFESFFIFSQPEPWKRHEFLRFVGVPLPGGYLIGGLLLVNLVLSHLYRFKMSWKKSGIFMIHIGLILLLLSQLLTQLVSEESMMSIPEGGQTWYSDQFRENELVLVDTSSAETDTVVSLPAERLKWSKPIEHPELPVIIQPVSFYENSMLGRRGDTNRRLPPSPATRGIGVHREQPSDVFVSPRPVTYQHDEVNTVSAYVQVLDRETGADLGIYLVSNVIDDRFPLQQIEAGGRTWDLSLRFRRIYHDFALFLHDFSFDRYPGTEIPMNFSSEVTVLDPNSTVEQNALIYMNHPLRYGGLTFYQADFDRETEATTVLQVVKNPGWQVPYYSVLLIGLGMCVQFGMHFFKFLGKRSTTSTNSEFKTQN